MRASKQALPIYWMLLYPHYIHLSVLGGGACPVSLLLLPGADVVDGGGADGGGGE